MIPVFAAMNRNPQQDLGTLKDQTWLTEVALGPFPDGIQSGIAYERVLLYPFNPQISETPLCFNACISPDDRMDWLQGFHDEIKGIPGALSEGGFGVVVRIARRKQALIEANDAARARDFAMEMETP